jgi:integral membrane protein (TIGR01906 family)
MKYLRKIITILIACLVPIILIFLGMRLLLTSGFLSVEYRMPGFPQDQFGFKQNERLAYSNIALDYLLNDSDINFLSKQQFPDGTSLFNSRELSHMMDGKKVVKPTLLIGYLSCLLLAIIALFLFLARLKSWFIKGLRFGAWIMLGLILSIGIFALVSFWNFFTIFHSIFFQGESWIFSYSDTLIRLFPLRFWQDAFLLEGFITIGASILILVVTRTQRELPPKI